MKRDRPAGSFIGIDNDNAVDEASIVAFRHARAGRVVPLERHAMPAGRDLESAEQRQHQGASPYLSPHYHLVFSTKNREPLILPQWRARLHEYLGGTISGLGCYPQGIGGTADHVHLFVGLRAIHCLADVLRELKKASSAWVREEIFVPSFSWQEGYAAFTVSATARVSVQRYIAHQEEHHRLKPYRDELVELLGKAGIEYDPKYLD